MQSGTALTHWAHVPPMIARERAEAFALLVGCRAGDGRILVDCLKKMPVEELIHAHNKFYVSGRVIRSAVFSYLLAYLEQLLCIDLGLSSCDTVPADG